MFINFSIHSLYKNHQIFYCAYLPSFPPLQHHRSKIINCTRWSELTNALEFHAELSDQANAVSEFRFINQRNPIIIGREDSEGKRKDALYELFEQGPGGQTPLCYHIREIIADIRRLEPELRQQNQKAAVIICTDGWMDSSLTIYAI